jgi:hypothetical protein
VWDGNSDEVLANSAELLKEFFLPLIASGKSFASDSLSQKVFSMKWNLNWTN